MSHHKQPRFEPDIRFLLANERTLLAWVRTSIGLEAGGLVVAHIGDNVSELQKALAIAIIALGATMALFGYLRYKSADEAIRQGRLPSQGKAPAIQAVGMIIIAAVLIILIVVGL